MVTRKQHILHSTKDRQTQLESTWWVEMKAKEIFACGDLRLETSYSVSSGFFFIYLFFYTLYCVFQKVEFTVGEEMEPKEASKKKVLSGEEISKQLDRLLQDKANNQRIRDWIEVCVRQYRVFSDLNTLCVLLFSSVVHVPPLQLHFVSYFQANLDEQQTASNQFVRALMTSVCQSAIICKYD